MSYVDDSCPVCFGTNPIVSGSLDLPCGGCGRRNGEPPVPFENGEPVWGPKREPEPSMTEPLSALPVDQLVDLIRGERGWYGTPEAGRALRELVTRLLAETQRADYWHEEYLAACKSLTKRVHQGADAVRERDQLNAYLAEHGDPRALRAEVAEERSRYDAYKGALARIHWGHVTLQQAKNIARDALSTHGETP